jgi:hypothetical protein
MEKNRSTDSLSRYHGLGAAEKKTKVREYSSKHQGLGIAQVEASTPRIRALQLLDNNSEPMIRHNPDATGCRIVTDELKPKNMKSKILHVQNGIVMITNQTRRDSLTIQRTTHSRRECHAKPHIKYSHHKDSGRKSSRKHTTHSLQDMEDDSRQKINCVKTSGGQTWTRT